MNYFCLPYEVEPPWKLTQNNHFEILTHIFTWEDAHYFRIYAKIFLYIFTVSIFKFWKFDNTDTVMLPFACLLNVEFDMLLRIFSRQQFKKGLYDYSFSGKKSVFFWTSNITPTQWKLNFILPKGTIFLILSSMCNSNPIFSFQVSETKRPIDNQFILTLLSRVPFRWTALSTPPKILRIKDIQYLIWRWVVLSPWASISLFDIC